MSSASSLKAKFEDLARPKDPNVEEVTKTSWKTSGHSGGMANEGKFEKASVVVSTKKKGTTSTPGPEERKRSFSLSFFLALTSRAVRQVPRQRRALVTCRERRGENLA